MNLKNFSLLLSTALLCTQVHSGVFERSSNIELESSTFFSKSKYNDHSQFPASIAFDSTFSYSMDQDRKLISFRPFVRVDSQDKQRSHFDIRELSYIAAFDRFEFKAGVSKEFWGVTESTHLVDIINQSDLVENIDGEEKLGQLMLNLKYQTNIGNFSAFLLPYFRKRTLPGKQGRLRQKLVFDENEKYVDSKKENHLDYALRWSHYFDNLDLGLSYFKGTNRDPYFVIGNNLKLAPLYTQIEQISIDSQLIIESWLLKLEAIKRNDSQNENYKSVVSGFEYTFSNIAQRGWDLGLIYEIIYDQRKEDSLSPMYNHSFFAGRFALNDVLSSEILIGSFVNNESKSISSLRIEASRRINSFLSWQANLNLIIDPKKESGLYSIKDDDYMRLGLSYYF